ncbi:MAG TPA: GNAT family N-acetyltransferase [Nitrospiraceae bacterium]|nr:GNAT family N-acetyltransferase [Nitrospiraceae bacterium]
MRCEWIPPESAEWLDIVNAAPHDFYHLPAYARLAAGAEGGTAGAFVIDGRRGRLLIPLIRREIGASLFDATSPYGYPSPLWSSPEGTELEREALSAFIDGLRRARVVSAFVRLHPLLTTELKWFEEQGEVVCGGETVYVDLGKTLDELWRNTRQNHRRSIRRALTSGFVARVDETWAHLVGFLTAYRETMTRVDAADYYFFRDQYFTDLRAALGERLHLFVVEHEGRVAAAALFTQWSGIVQYHLGGTCDEFLSVAPMKLLFHFARTWFKERGCAVMHLGGGVGSRHDSVFHFKAGFASTRRRFHSWRVVAEPRAYAELVERWCRETGREPSGAYFPAYREPR